MIIRAHECVMDGFERFAQGLLITVFSATNYCGTANNAGAILVLGRDLTLYPKLIHPLPPSALTEAAERTRRWMGRGRWGSTGIDRRRRLAGAVTGAADRRGSLAVEDRRGVGVSSGREVRSWRL